MEQFEYRLRGGAGAIGGRLGPGSARGDQELRYPDRLDCSAKSRSLSASRVRQTAARKKARDSVRNDTRCFRARECQSCLVGGGPAEQATAKRDLSSLHSSG